MCVLVAQLQFLPVIWLYDDNDGDDGDDGKGGDDDGGGDGGNDSDDWDACVAW